MTRVETTDASGDRPPWQRWRWVTLATAFGVAIGLAIWQQVRAVDALWQRAVARATVLAPGLEMDVCRRLLGVTAPGNAFDDYAAALTLAAGVPLDAAATRRLLDDQPPDRAARAAVLAQMAPALAALHDGAHRAAAGRWPRLEVDLVAAAHAVALASRLQADAQAERGDGDAAVATLLDLLQFARDLMLAPRWRAESLGAELIAHVHGDFAAEQGARMLRLPLAALGVFDLGLANLDATLPAHSRALLGDAVDTVLHLDHDAELREDLAMLATGAWRYGFSPRALAARHLEHVEQHVRDCGDALAAGRGDGDVVADLIELRRRIDRSNNPLTRRIAIAGQGDPALRVNATTQMRLWRLAIQHRLGSAAPTLPDPRGGLLEGRIQAGLFRAASRHPGAPSLTLAGSR